MPSLLALANVPLMEHSHNRYAPRLSTHRPALRMMSSKTPACVEIWNPRCTVLFEPIRRGESFHLAPLSRIQKDALDSPPPVRRRASALRTAFVLMYPDGAAIELFIRELEHAQVYAVHKCLISG